MAEYIWNKGNFTYTISSVYQLKYCFNEGSIFTYKLSVSVPPLIYDPFCLNDGGLSLSQYDSKVWVGCGRVTDSIGIKRIEYRAIVIRNQIPIQEYIYVYNYNLPYSLEILNPSTIFNTIILSTDDIIDWQIRVTNSADISTIRSGQVVVQVKILSHYAWNKGSFSYGIIDGIPPVIDNIYITNPNKGIIRTGTTQVMLWADNIFDELSNLQSIIYELAINPIEPVIYTYSWVDISPNPEGMFDGGANHTFSMPALSGSDIVFGRITASDTNNQQQRVLKSITVEGIPCRCINPNSYLNYNITEDISAPVITNVIITNDLGNLLDVGDTKIKINAEVNDINWLLSVQIYLKIDSVLQYPVYQDENQSGIRSNIWTVSSLNASDQIDYEVRAIDRSGNIGIYANTYFIPSGDIEPPIVTNPYLVGLPRQKRVLPSDRKVRLGVGNIYDLLSQVIELKLSYKNTQGIWEFREITDGNLSGEYYFDIDNQDFKNFIEVDGEIFSKDTMNNAKTNKLYYMFDNFNDYKEKIIIDKVEIGEVEIIKDIEFKDIEMGELSVKTIPASVRWIRENGNYDIINEKLVFNSDNSSALFYDNRIKFNSIIEFNGNGQVEIGSGFVRIKGDKDSFIDNLSVKSLY